jgi:uncharacterized membrane protein (DUF2068 family)
MAAKATRSAPKRGKHHTKGLVLIGLLKLMKGTLFVALGLGLLKLLHHDLYTLAMRLVEALRFDPGNAFINTLLGQVSLLNDHRLRQLGIFALAYAALDFLEGIGLVLEKAWAEFVTLALTASFLPIEALKTVHHPTEWKFLVILANFAVVVYLAWLIFRQRGR